jgi:hypothetical protein
MRAIKGARVNGQVITENDSKGVGCATLDRNIGGGQAACLGGDRV